MKTYSHTRPLIFLFLACAIVYFAWSRRSQSVYHVKWKPIVEKQGREIGGVRPVIYAEFDFDAICKHEWEQISTYAFFRRDSAFYIIDARQIVLLFLGQHDKRDAFDYHVAVFIDGERTHSAKIRGDKNWFDNIMPSEDLCFYKIRIPFDLLKYNSVRSEARLDELLQAGRIAVRVHVRDKELGKASENELELVFKYLHRQSLKKRSTMVCNRCYYLKKSATKQMEWWFEMSKRAGYEQIYICNNTLEYGQANEDGFEALFNKYSGYVELVQMNCMPHFLSRDGKTLNGSRYINSVHDLVDHEGKFAVFKLYVYEIFALNMCYLRHAQDYRHVVVIDVDEGLFPPLIESQFYYHDNFDYVRQLSLSSEADAKRAVENLKCGRYSPPDLSQTSDDYRTITEQYVRDIIAKDRRYKDPESLSFHNAWQLTAVSVAKIMAKFEELFASLNSTDADYLVRVPDETLQSYEIYEPVFKISISGADELDYARNLVKIYHLYLQPYLKSIKPALANVSDLHNRFFTLASSKFHQLAWGKTVHNTMSSRSCSHHYPVRTPYLQVDYDFGQVIHFRDQYKVPKSDVISVKKLMFDFNYLNCFFKPILSDLVK